jgi:hypothetical protein
MTNINEIIATLQSRLESVNGSIKEIDEMKEDEFNPSDWSGGNFDDAYFIGEEHGDCYATSNLLSEFIGILTKLRDE